jgi:acetyl esterase/lipase
MKRRWGVGLRERVEYLTAVLLGRLPGRVQVLLSGRPAVVVEGERLLPEVQLSLALLERRGEAHPEALGATAARLERRRLAAVFAGPPERVAAVQDRTLELDCATIAARHYAPPEAGGPHPLLVYYHGGGFTYGDLDTHDGLCRLLCSRAGVHLLAVDYRLAPEHQFPAAVEDARAALAWACANAALLGADPLRVGVGGDSAGGNLAAVVCQLAAHDGGPSPAVQLLIYPVTDMSRRHRSRALYGEGFLLTDAEMGWFETNYLGPGREQAADPRASPLLAEDLTNLPPALVFTAAFDPLRDEGEQYARALRAAGTRVLLRRFAGFIHAFASAAGVSRPCREAVIEIAGALRAAFAGTDEAALREADTDTAERYAR